MSMQPELSTKTAEKAAAVSAGETTVVTFKLRGLGTIEGTVENEFTDAVLKGVRIGLYTGDGDLMGEVTTGDDGAFHFRGVRAGVYSVRLTLPQGYRSNESTEKSLQVGSGTTARVDFTIHRHGTVQGRIVDEETGDPLAGLSVELVDSDGDVVRTETTDEDGNYEFSELEVDRYTVRVAVPEHYALVEEPADDDDDSEPEAEFTDA